MIWKWNRVVQTVTMAPMISPKKSTLAQPRTDERLAKRVAAIVHCSRREAEQYIEGGWVKVNGQLVEEPMFRVSNQEVEIDPHASLMEPGDVTLLLHKPAGFDTMDTPGQTNARVKPAQQLC